MFPLNRNKCTAKKLCRLFFSCSLLFVPAQAFAIDYYWRSISFPSIEGTDPAEVCQQVSKAYFNRNFSDHITYIGGGIYEFYPHSNTAQCFLMILNSNVGHVEKFNSNSKIRIKRIGTTCPEGLAYNPSTGRCDLDQQKGPPPENSCTGNPINFAIGNKFQSEVDYQASGNSALSFSRTYNSLDGLWRHSFSTYLRITSTQYVSVVLHHGRESFFTVSDTTITPTSADLGVLSQVGTTGWQYLSANNERFIFDSAGKLTQWSNAHGAVHQFAYAGNQVTVTDNLGNSLSFTEDADHQPLTLTAPGVQITYGYNVNKRLTSVTRVAGGQTTQRQFHYEDSRNNSWLTGITDERGVRYATWSYDDKGRAISSEHANGADRVSVAYNTDGTVSVTNELDKVAKYSFQYIKGVRRITSIQGEPSANCPNSNSSFTYDSNGLLKTKTDNKGILTTYTYNTRGLEVSRTEASGTPQARTITTDWHPTLFLPAVVTEPNQITRYQYDDQGRQLSRTIEER